VRAHGCNCVGALAWDGLSVARVMLKAWWCRPILHTSAPLEILPTHDLLYTIIGPLNAA
jgi:hypothetical protein